MIIGKINSEIIEKIKNFTFDNLSVIGNNFQTNSTTVQVCSG